MKMRMNYRCLGTTVTMALLTATLANAQLKIVAHTIEANYCNYVGAMKTGQLIIDSLDLYEQLEFEDAYGDRCMPFNDIDFKKNILVGFTFRGSNCDTRIEMSRILKQETRYLIQFVTGPNHVCRDMKYRFAWFVIERPEGEFEIAFERL
jgi:hypothetical protein